jgi:hypothetical protein
VVAALGACGSDAPGADEAASPDTARSTTASGVPAAEPTTDAPAPEPTSIASTAGVAETVAADGRPVSWDLREDPTFLLVTGVDVVWPTPVPAAALAIGDVDGARVCADLAAAGAFPGVVPGESAGTSAFRAGEELTIGCTFVATAEAPFDVAAFSDAMRDSFSTVEDGEPAPTPNGSYGIVEIRVAGDPTDGLPELGEIDRRPGLACAAAALAVGLPDGWWTSGTTRLNDDSIFRCVGPIPDPPVVTPDSSIVASYAGDAIPPKEG